MPLWICADPSRGTIGLPPYLALTASALNLFDLRNQGVPLRLIVPGVRNGPREGQEASIDVARVGWRSKLLHRPDSCLRCQSMQNIELAHCLTAEVPLYGKLLERGMRGGASVRCSEDWGGCVVWEGGAGYPGGLVRRSEGPSLLRAVGVMGGCTVRGIGWGSARQELAGGWCVVPDCVVTGR